jgi:hypothetical protein
MNELDDLLAKADRIIAAGDRLSAAFARELAAVWRDAERALTRLIVEATEGSRSAALSATRALVLREQIRNVLEASGYDALVTAAASVRTTAVVTAVLGSAAATEAASFVARIEPALEALRRLSTLDLMAQGDEVAIALWRSTTQHLFTARPVTEIIEDLADALDREVAHVRGLYDTQIAVLGRQVEAIKTEDLGSSQPFLYVGPLDLKTRDFCIERVGKVFTRAEIDEMDNGQMGETFLTGGGYNCRHSWIAVESRELRGMVGTGERVAPIAEDVSRLRQLKEARKAAKRKKAA